jgi:hypothetical protein
MNTPLAILIEAVECMRLLREVEARASSNSMQNRDDFMRCLRSYSEFKAHVSDMTKLNAHFLEQ